MDQQVPKISIKNILESQYHSFIWLSLRTRISTKKLQAFDKGKSLASPSEIQKIAEILNVSEEEMINRTR